MIDLYLSLFQEIIVKMIQIAPIILVVWFGVDLFSSLFFGRGK